LFPSLVSNEKKGQTFNKGIKWVVGRDNNLKLWFDNYTTHGPLRNMIQGPLSIKGSNMRIQDILKEG